MNFSERLKRESETVNGGKAIRITEKQFDDAIQTAAEKIFSNKELPNYGRGKMLLILGGMTFAHDVQRILFDGKGEED